MKEQTEAAARGFQKKLFLEISQYSQENTLKRDFNTRTKIEGLEDLLEITQIRSRYLDYVTLQ